MLATVPEMLPACCAFLKRLIGCTAGIKTNCKQCQFRNARNCSVQHTAQSQTQQKCVLFLQQSSHMQDLSAAGRPAPGAAVCAACRAASGCAATAGGAASAGAVAACASDDGASRARRAGRTDHDAARAQGPDRAAPGSCLGLQLPVRLVSCDWPSLPPHSLIQVSALCPPISLAVSMLDLCAVPASLPSSEHAGSLSCSAMLLNASRSMCSFAGGSRRRREDCLSSGTGSRSPRRQLAPRRVSMQRCAMPLVQHSQYRPAPERKACTFDGKGAEEGSGAAAGASLTGVL